MRAVWTCVVLWLAGCDIPPEVQSEMACTTVCGCFAPQPQVEPCIEDCVARGNFATVPEDCFECIQAHANTCSTLEDECEPLCAQSQPPTEEDRPDGGMQ